jgi:hypothetical protein
MVATQTSQVLTADPGSISQTEALMYLIHFIGDIHQPLHTEALDRGGNSIHVCFDNRCGRENLHGIWDTDIPHKINGIKHAEKHNAEKEAAARWADRLSQGSSARSVEVAEECVDLSDPAKCALEWASETNAFVCSYVLANGVEWLESNDLGGEYYEGAVPVVEDRISKAGIRLAGWLNALAAAAGGSGLVVQDWNIDL